MVPQTPRPFDRAIVFKPHGKQMQKWENAVSGLAIMGYPVEEVEADVPAEDRIALLRQKTNYVIYQPFRIANGDNSMNFFRMIASELRTEPYAPLLTSASHYAAGGLLAMLQRVEKEDPALFERILFLRQEQLENSVELIRAMREHLQKCADLKTKDFEHRRTGEFPRSALASALTKKP